MLLHIISDPYFLHLPVPVCVPDIRQLRALPCYTLTTAHTLFHIPGFFPSRPSHHVPLDLSMSGSYQFHHCSIRQLWSMPDARLFVARAAEYQAARSHYC